MSGNQLPVLTLDIDEEKIRQLNEISEKFKAAFAVGPGGHPVTIPGGVVKVPGDTHPTPEPGSKEKPEFNSFLKNLNKEASGTLKTFGLINKTLSATTSTLKGLFGETLSWGAKLAAFATGGFLGFDAMAQHVTQNLMNAQGLGMTNGQVLAAHSVYGKHFSSTDDTLQALANARNNPASKEYRALRSLNLNPADNAAANLPKFYEAIDNVRKTHGSNALAVLGGMGVDWIGARDLNEEEANSGRLPQLAQQFQDRSTRNDSILGVKTQQQYQETSSHLSDNADQIGNSFLASIARLNGPINQLSDTLTKDIDGFLNGPNGQAVFKAVSDGLTDLGNWLNSAEFQGDLTSFCTAVKNLVIAVGDAARWINGFFGNDEAEEKTIKEVKARSSFNDEPSSTGGKDLPGAKGGETKGDFLDLLKAIANTTLGLFTGGRVTVDSIEARTRAGGWSNYQNQLQQNVANINDKGGLPKGMLNAVAEQESHWDPNALSKAGAAGLFQFIPETANAYGLNNMERYDPQKSAEVAARYFSDNMRRYHGDIAESLAQYNGGNAAVTKDGNLNINKETVDYLLKILPHVQGGLEQHPGLYSQLRNADRQLEKNPGNTRATISLEVVQKPGADYHAQILGQYIPQ